MNVQNFQFEHNGEMFNAQMFPIDGNKTTLHIYIGDVEIHHSEFMTGCIFCIAHPATDFDFTAEAVIALMVAEFEYGLTCLQGFHTAFHVHTANGIQLQLDFMQGNRQIGDWLHHQTLPVPVCDKKFLPKMIATPIEFRFDGWL